MYASVSIWKDCGSYFLSGFRDLEQNICEVVTQWWLMLDIFLFCHILIFSEVDLIHDHTK